MSIKLSRKEVRALEEVFAKVRKLQESSGVSSGLNVGFVSANFEIESSGDVISVMVEIEDNDNQVTIERIEDTKVQISQRELKALAGS